MLIVLTTVSDETEGKAIAEGLVDAGLAACVQILPKMTSVYSWKGEVHSDPEHLLLIKTLESRYEEVEAYLRRNHSYEVPEIVAVPASKVSDPYLKWMTDLVGPEEVS